MLTLGHNLISLQGTQLALSWCTKCCTNRSSYAGEEHRRERKMMVPAFSIKNMRAMTSIFYDVAHKVKFSSVQSSSYFLTDVTLRCVAP